jgi:hypothetical protein
MEAVGASEMSVNFYETKRYNVPEDCDLHTGRRENKGVTSLFGPQSKLKRGPHKN